MKTTFYAGKKPNEIRVYDKTAERLIRLDATVPNGFDFALSSLSAGGRERSDPTLTLAKKLREQAKRHGLEPGTPGWRAYVLGGEAAAKVRAKRKRSRRA
jgi:hypothetical protein